MTWKLVIILAIASAVFSAIGLIVPALKTTSFSDPGTYLDIWFVFAIFIIMNCKSPKEAAIKTFVFFLISQPLIYLIQVPFSWQGFGLFQYYPRWFAFTVATLPGAVIAYQIKKQNWLSVAILSVANVYFALAGASYTHRAINNLPKTGIPNHALSAVFCMAAAIALSFTLFDQKKHKIVAAAIPICAYIAFYAAGITF